MVKEITEDEDDDKNDENDSTSGSSFRFSLICKVFDVHHTMQNIDYMSKIDFKYFQGLCYQNVIFLVFFKQRISLPSLQLQLIIQT